MWKYRGVHTPRSPSGNHSIAGVVLGIGALEAVAAASSLVVFQFFLYSQMGGLHPACFQVEDDLTLRLHAQERYLVGEGLGQGLRLGGDAEDRLGPVEAFAGIALHAGVLLAGARGRLQREVRLRA